MSETRQIRVRYLQGARDRMSRGRRGFIGQGDENSGQPLNSRKEAVLQPSITIIRSVFAILNMNSL